MSAQATDITFEDDAIQRLPLKLEADSRALPCRQENEEPLPVCSTRGSFRSTASQSVCVACRSPTHSSLEENNSPTSREHNHTTLISYSSSETVTTPPFIPTERHHNFFMDDVDSEHCSCGDSNMENRRGLDKTQRPANLVDTFISHEKSEVAMEPFPKTGRQHTDEHTPPVSSVIVLDAAEREEAPHQQSLEATEENIQVHERRIHKRNFPLVAKAPPFDATREQQWNCLSMGRDRELPLYKFEEIPSWQKYNPFIRSHYRAFYSTRMCFKSLFGWHNETINVYSHLLTFFFFLVFTVLLYTTVLNKVIDAPSLGATKQMYGILCFGSLICMLNSTLYHLFNSHCSCRVMTAMGRLDFVGITALIVSSFLPPLYVMFHCNPMARTVYITSILMLGMAGVIGPWTDAFHTHVWVRLSVFLGVGFSGVIPVIHFAMLFPINAASSSTVMGILLMVLLYISGVVFYVTKFPECRYPGHFDCWLSSHQMWHLFVSMAAAVHYFNCVGMYQLWKVSDGMCG